MNNPLLGNTSILKKMHNFTECIISTNNKKAGWLRKHYSDLGQYLKKNFKYN